MQGCPHCQKAKPRTGKAPVELHPTPTPPGPWAQIRWDIIGLITESSGKDAILCITNMFTKAIKHKPINTTITGKGVAHVFRDQLYWEKGLPDKIYSD